MCLQWLYWRGIDATLKRQRPVYEVVVGLELLGAHASTRDLRSASELSDARSSC